MSLPLAHGLVGASVVAATRSNLSPCHDWKPLLLGAFLAILPDFDFFLIWLFNLDWDWHRSFTHSISFAIACGVLSSLRMNNLNLNNILTYTAATFSHGILDFLTAKRWEGVELLWPLSRERFKLGLTGFFEFHMNYRTSASLSYDMVKFSLIELLIFAPLAFNHPVDQS